MPTPWALCQRSGAGDYMHFSFSCSLQRGHRAARHAMACDAFKRNEAGKRGGGGRIQTGSDAVKLAYLQCHTYYRVEQGLCAVRMAIILSWWHTSAKHACITKPLRALKQS